MFRLMQSTPVGGDCCCGYRVELDKEYTVAEFIQTVIENEPNEWGYIGIHKPREIFGKPYISYSCGKIESDIRVMNEVLDRKIVKVTASGGWSRMDYELYLEE